MMVVVVVVYVCKCACFSKVNYWFPSSLQCVYFQYGIRLIVMVVVMVVAV